jgi:type VI secretion system protein ImpH
MRATAPATTATHAGGLPRRLPPPDGVAVLPRARRAEPAISLDRPDSDRFADYVGSLFGIGAPGLRERDEIGDFAKLHFAGLMANQRRPAAGLVTILRAYFKLPVAIEQFVGHWMKIPLDGQTRIGMPKTGQPPRQLGRAGQESLGLPAQVPLVIGPLDYDDYQRMLPGGASMTRLRPGCATMPARCSTGTCACAQAEVAAPEAGRRAASAGPLISASGPAARDARPTA